MIGHEAFGGSFKELADYLEHGGDGTRHGRVDWTHARNVWAPTIHDAAAVMTLVASASRTRSPVYHLSISFHMDDGAGRDLMVRVADRLLVDLGLTEHQTVVVAHNDRDHAHFHVMVNRVHPRTGRVWKLDFSKQSVERALRLLERELGLRESPGHLYRLPDQARPERSRSRGAGVLRREQRTGERPYVEIARAELADDFALAEGFADLESRLAAKGCRLEARPRGLVVTDGRGYAAVSAISPTASRAKLEARFGQSFASVTAGEPARRAAREPGSRGADEPIPVAAAYPGTRASIQSSLDLTMADAPLERPRRTLSGRDVSSPARAPIQAEPTDPPPPTAPLEELRRELPAVVAAFREEIRAAAAETGAQRLAELTASLDARARSIEAGLEEAARETQGVVKLMEEVLDSAVELAADGAAVPGGEPGDPGEAGGGRPESGAPGRGDHRQGGGSVEAARGHGAGTGDGGAARGSAPGVAALDDGGHGRGTHHPSRDAAAARLDDEQRAAPRAPRRGGGDLHLRHGEEAGAGGDAAGDALARAGAAGLDRRAADPTAAMNPEARFSLYEDGGVCGVFDSFGPQVFFAETRDRAVAEVARANEIVARFPMTISMRHLREMDADWRAARGLPPLPEPQGRRVVVAVDPPASDGVLGSGAPTAAHSLDRSPGTGRAAPVPAPPPVSAVASTLATAAEVAARLALRRRVQDARLDLDRTVQLADELTRAATEANAPLARFRSAISALYGDQAEPAERAFRRLCIERGVDEAVRALADDPRSLLPEPRPRLLAGGPRAREAACEQARLCAPYLTRLDRVVETAGRHGSAPTGQGADDPVGLRPRCRCSSGTSRPRSRACWTKPCPNSAG